MFAMGFLLDDKIEKYFRTYENILNILAKLGGLKESLLLIIGILICPLSKLHLNIRLVN
jgi:hypothetical protein